LQRFYSKKSLLGWTTREAARLVCCTRTWEKASLIRFDMIPTLNGADWPCLLLTTVLHQTRLAPPAGFSPIAFSVPNPGIPAQRLGVTRSRPLGKNGIAHLCEQDVSALTANLLALEPGAKSVVVLPTHDLASWLHARAGFISEKVNATYAETKGSIK
jgi:hypothetical protein